MRPGIVTETRRPSAWPWLSPGTGRTYSLAMSRVLTVSEPESPVVDVAHGCVAIVGGGPAGLMAAEVLQAQGFHVHLFDGMPSVGRKFLLAGRGGLNLTHAEPDVAFRQRYGVAGADMSPMLSAFGPQQVRDWAAALGVDTFVGTSQRVFPVGMKAAPLLRAWLSRLKSPRQGIPPVTFWMRHRWQGFDADGCSVFSTPHGRRVVPHRALVLALGGGSWPRLGSDGGWIEPLRQQGVGVRALQPSNCGFDVQGGWSAHFADRFAGLPFKSVAVHAPALNAGGWGLRDGGAEPMFNRRGEFVATHSGVEGSLIYAMSGGLMACLQRDGRAEFRIDLLPGRSVDRVNRVVRSLGGSRSISSQLKRGLGLDGIKMALLYEVLGAEGMHHPQRLADAIKGCPLELSAPRPMAEAISTAGGVNWSSLNDDLSLKVLPHVFCTGEMVDWDAPTGGYLLTACMALGRWAGAGAARFLTAETEGKHATVGGQ